MSRVFTQVNTRDLLSAAIRQNLSFDRSLRVGDEITVTFNVSLDNQAAVDQFNQLRREILIEESRAMSKPKFDRNYARRKLELVLRDLRDYTADEFWREISRIASGATGLPSAEQLKEHTKELEAELAAARAGWQETIAKMASHERPAYDEQQQRIARLEAINLGLTKTLVEMEKEKAALVEALEPFAKCARELDGSPEDGIDPADDDEWAKFRLLVSDYRRARAALSAYRKGGE